MAQPGQSLRYICRSCRHKVLQVPKAATARLFSNTRQLSKTIPTFVDTPSAELNDLLATLRSKIFTPAALSLRHQRLVYKRRNDELLTKGPGVTVTMDDDEEVKLQPMEYYDKPARHEYLKKFVGLLTASQDPATWNNLIPFLEGVVLTRRDMPPFLWEKLVRKAGQLGKEGNIIQCAEIVDRTNFRLSRPGVARELFIAFHRHAASAGFKEDELTTAFRRAEKIALLLESEKHRPVKTVADNKEKSQTQTVREADPRSDPLILGVLLELSALKAINKDGASDIESKVVSYAEKLSYLLANPPSKTSSKLRGRDIEYLTRTVALEEAVIMQNAIRSALKVQSVEKAVLESYLKKLDLEVENEEKWVREHSNGKRRALELYDEIHGEK